MSIIVQKFGGTSVENSKKILAAARKAIRAHKNGNQVVMVVSAMGQNTDILIDLAKQITDEPPAREMDMLLSTGEQVSVALMAMAIDTLGYKAVSMTGAPIGICNGGGLRTSVEAGDVTRLALMHVNPWNNPMCTVEMTGQAMLDLLEFNSRYLPDAECGGFCQVSGMSYEVDSTIPSPVKLDEKGAFAGVEEGKKRRVSNVRVDGIPVDPAKSYTVAGPKFCLLDGGDGNGGVQGIKALKTEGFPTDAECLLKFFTENLKGKITMEEYGNPLGAGRIVIRK